MVDRRYTQTSQSSRGGRAASLVIVALLLTLLIAASSAGATTLKEKFTRGSLPKGGLTVGNYYDLGPVATWGTAPYVLWTSGSMPAGMGVNEAGELAGVPAEAGTYRFTIHARDNAGQVGSLRYTLKVALAFRPLSIGTPVLYAGAWGAASEVVSGGSGWYSFSAKKVPPGMTVLTNGAEGGIEGVPTKAGSYTVTLVATDDVTGAKGDVRIRIRVSG